MTTLIEISVPSELRNPYATPKKQLESYSKQINKLANLIALRLYGKSLKKCIGFAQKLLPITNQQKVIVILPIIPKGVCLPDILYLPKYDSNKIYSYRLDNLEEEVAYMLNHIKSMIHHAKSIYGLNGTEWKLINEK